MTSHSPSGILYIVSTPIGNPDDISKRAIDILQQCDLIVCEEYKVGSRLLKQLGISNSLETVNEHNEVESSIELIKRLRQGEAIAIISDCGTPVFADPGTHLVQSVVANGIQVIPIPGASSLMAALVCGAFRIKEFYYVGFLPRTSSQRQKKLKELQKIKTVLIIYEAPYRLLPLLKDMLQAFNAKTPTVICTRLTQPDEKIFRGSLKKLYQHFEAHPIKCEFVILIDNIKAQRPIKASKKRYHS